MEIGDDASQPLRKKESSNCVDKLQLTVLIVAHRSKSGDGKISQLYELIYPLVVHVQVVKVKDLDAKLRLCRGWTMVLQDDSTVNAQRLVFNFSAFLKFATHRDILLPYKTMDACDPGRTVSVGQFYVVRRVNSFRGMIFHSSLLKYICETENERKQLLQEDSKTVTLTNRAKRYIDAKLYKNVSSSLLIDKIEALKNYTVSSIKKHVNPLDVLLNTSLDIVHSTNQFDEKTIEDKRNMLAKYIKQSYPYWETVNASNPEASLTTLIQTLQENYPRYSTCLDAIQAIALRKCSRTELNSICTQSMIIIALVIYYIHVKRDPKYDESGVRYVRNKYCKEVDIQKWAANYKIDLTEK